MTRSEFRRALRQGRGRGFLHIRDHGDAGVRDELLDLCATNGCYDSQCEGSRAEWLSTTTLNTIISIEGTEWIEIPCA